MDLLTHAALSAAGGAVLTPRAKLRAGAAAGALAGILPDADMLIGSPADPLLNLELHRHFTHSLAFAPLGAAVAALLAWLVLRRSIGMGALYGSALGGYLLALLLDACTSYGTHLLWPFAASRVSLSIVPVVDPLFTAAVAIPLALAVARRRAVWACASLILAALALGAGFVQHQRATEQAALLAQARGHHPERALVKPTLGNMLLWRSLYLYEGRLYADAVRVGLPGNVTTYSGESAPLLRMDDGALPPPGTRARSDLERFVAFADGLAVRHPRRPDFVGDARYAMLPTSLTPLWGIELAATSDQPARFETARDWSPALRRRFVDMLLGRALAPSGA